MRSNVSLRELILRENTLGERSGKAFYEAIKNHPNIQKIDLSFNLMTLRYIQKINDITSVNCNKGDLSQLPNLKREYTEAKNKKL
jgi:uncharacterized pyridoxamine 5'-phosphate oxidase family protein